MSPETPEGEGFRAALRNAPDSARLVFAGRLEDRGGPRAAWLRGPDVWAWMTPDARDPVPPLLAAEAADELGVDCDPVRQEAYAVLQGLGAAAVRPAHGIFSAAAGWE